MQGIADLTDENGGKVTTNETKAIAFFLTVSFVVCLRKKTCPLPQNFLTELRDLLLQN